MNNNQTLIAIDQGTTSSRAILFSINGDIVDLHQKELKLHYPNKGWVEAKADDIWHDTRECCAQILKHCDQLPVAIGITNQRETTLIWDRKTGDAVYNAIVWQDRRTADFCEQLKGQGYEDIVSAKTGLLLDPYFSASKIAWILDNVEGVRQRAVAGDLAFGTVECYLLWKLTGGKVHATDATNASRTMLYNLQTQDWDDELLKIFNIPVALLPDVYDNMADFGVSEASLLGAEIPIGGMAGDQHAALIGQGCLNPGMVKSTYGTGCFALMNIGSKFKQSQNRLLTTAAYRIDGKMTYAIEGSIFVAGAVIQWLRDGLGLLDDVAESETLARSVPDNNEVYFVPAFTGLGAPYWRPYARALITGLSRETTKAHIVRAALEAQAYQTLDLIGAMEKDGGHKAEVIRIDGGLVANNFMCQFLVDMIQRPAEVPKVAETTAWGAALLAGVQTGVFDSLEASAKEWRADRRFRPEIDLAESERLYSGWQTAVSMLLQD